MIWDFAEPTLSAVSSAALSSSDSTLMAGPCFDETSVQLQSRKPMQRCPDRVDSDVIVVTDPPYYDNIGYADLSDFFYVWLRRSIGVTFQHSSTRYLRRRPQELVASPYRYGGKYEAEAFFETGLANHSRKSRSEHNPRFPLPSSTPSSSLRPKDGVVSTGWETLLQGLIAAWFHG